MGGARASLIAAVLLAGCYRSAVPAPDGGHDAGPPVDQARAFVEARRIELCRRAVECEPRARGRRVWIQDFCHPALWPSEVEQVASRARWFDPVEAEACLRLLGGGTGCLASYREWIACFGDVFPDALARGAACDVLSDHCGPDLRCSPERCVCEPAAPIGAACSLDIDCADDARCSPGGTCLPDAVPRGAPCTTHSDCSSDDFCTQPACHERLVCIEGSCEPPDAFEPGDSCGDLLDCGPDLACRHADGTWVCDEPPPLGGDCSDLAGTRCRDGLQCIDAVCSPPPGEGEVCPAGVRCADDAPYCVFGTDAYRCQREPTGLECYSFPVHLVDLPDLGCPGTSHACIPRGLGDPGPGTCQPIVGIGDACSDPALCPPAARCVDGRCVRIVMPDQPCGPDAVCPPTHVCDGTCIPRPVLGEPCDTERACLRGACIGGRCAHRAVGEACSGVHECEHGCDYDVRRCSAPAREGETCSVSCDRGLHCAWWLDEPICIVDACPAD